MSPADAPRGPLEAPRPAAPQSTEVFRQIARFLYTQSFTAQCGSWLA